MKYLNKITSDAFQNFILTGNPGQSISMTLRYMPSQSMWMMDVSAGTFDAKGIHVISSPNMLRNFKNIISFGIACVTKDNLDPYYGNDFATQRCSLFLLTGDDVRTIEESYFK